MNKEYQQAMNQLNIIEKQMIETQRAETILNYIILIVALVWIIDCCILLNEILRNEYTNNNKLIWIVAIIFVPVIGNVFYRTIGRQQIISNNCMKYTDETGILRHRPDKFINNDNNWF